MQFLKTLLTCFKKKMNILARHRKIRVNKIGFDTKTVVFCKKKIEKNFRRLCFPKEKGHFYSLIFLHKKQS